jgi:rRNA maturation endonuclease Nob1
MEVEETHKECIECFRMFEKPDDDADVCAFCNGDLRRR